MTQTTIITDAGQEKIRKYAVTEIFGPTLQGEGILTGALTHFVRFGGCSLQCTWCDSLDSVIPERVKANATYMDMDQIYKELDSLPDAPWVTLTGGDPCIQKDLDQLINYLNVQGVQVAIETQGMHFPEWLQLADVITFSPKGPSSDNVVDPQTLIDWLTEHHNSQYARICIKVVIANREDMEYALDLYQRIPSGMYEAFYFNAASVVYTPEMLQAPNAVAVRQLESLAMYQSVAQMVINQAAHEGILSFNDKVRVGCQQHVLLWPGAVKGV